jgi:uncharacterized membrane protein YgcG
MSIIALTWPSDLQEASIWERFYLHFSLYFLYHGCFQFVQSRFQAARLMVRLSIGKAARMDVSSTETITEFNPELWVVVAMSVVGHGAQTWLGVNLIRMLLQQLSSQQSRPWYAFKEEIQCALMGALFLILGVVNFGTTVQTLLEKWAKEAAGRRATAQRRDAQQAGVDGGGGRGGSGDSGGGGGGGGGGAGAAVLPSAPSESKLAATTAAMQPEGTGKDGGSGGGEMRLRAPRLNPAAQ